MAKRMTKELLLAAMAPHVLANGLATASLRPLAKAARTSDRMLIYHFGSKEELVAALLDYLAQSFSDGLDAARPTEPAGSRAECLAQIVPLIRRPELAGHLRIWFEAVSHAKAGEPIYAKAVHEIQAYFLNWVQLRLPVDDPDPEAATALILTILDGIEMLDATGHSATADQAVALFAQISDGSSGSIS